MSNIYRTRIGRKDYERVLRHKLGVDSLFISKYRGPDDLYCLAYKRLPNDLPVGLWESDSHGWVWKTWKVNY